MDGARSFVRRQGQLCNWRYMTETDNMYQKRLRVAACRQSLPLFRQLEHNTGISAVNPAGSCADLRTSTVGSPGSRERLIEYGQQVALSQGGFEHLKGVPHTRKIDAVFLHAQEHDHVRDVLGPTG